MCLLYLLIECLTSWVYMFADIRKLDSNVPAENVSLSLDAENDDYDDDDDDANLLIYPYERLKVASNEPVSGIDVTKREVILC